MSAKTKTKSEPRAYRKGGKIIIEMPESNLIFAVENNPRYGVWISNKEAYLDNVTKNLLEYTSGTDDDPLFFRLFDEITEDMLEYGGDGVEPVEDKED